LVFHTIAKRSISLAALRVVAKSHLLTGFPGGRGSQAYYAQITTINSVAFAAVVAYIMTRTPYGFVGMWWAHVGMYAVNVCQFALRASGAAQRAKAKQLALQAKMN
jgi:hypothetical protein